MSYGRRYYADKSPLFQVVENKPEPRKSSGLIRETLAAAFIVGAVFWVPWLFYFITGNYMEFGQ